MGKDNASGQDHSAEHAHGKQRGLMPFYGEFYNESLYVNVIRLFRLLQSSGVNVVIPGSDSVYAIKNAVLGFLGNRNSFDLRNDDTVLLKHLTFALLVPAGKASRARAAVNALFLYQKDPTQLSWSVIENIIRPNVRFFRQKSLRLWKAYQNWGKLRTDVRDKIQIYNLLCLADVRNMLLERVDGLGKKASAHLMRNWGLFTYANGYPIIDVHIYKILGALGLSCATYDEAEHSFCLLANLVSIPVLWLDAILWCAMANNYDPAQADFDNFKSVEIEQDGNTTYCSLPGGSFCDGNGNSPPASGQPVEVSAGLV